MRHPEASHANYYASSISVSAKPRDLLPLHHRAITNGLDRWPLKRSGADPSHSRLEHGNGEGMACWAQGGAFNRAVIRERDTVNQETLQMGTSPRLIPRLTASVRLAACSLPRMELM
jgi:hypothetical protein